MTNNFAQRKFNPIHANEGSHPQCVRPTHEAGQSLVEFGLVVGLIVIIMLGSFEIFDLLQQKADLDKLILQSARQAGEFGGVATAGDEGEKEIKAYIRRQLENLSYTDEFINPALDSMTITVYELNSSGSFDLVPSTTECEYGQFVQLNIKVDWDISLPIVLFFSGFVENAQFDLTSTARCWRAI